MLLAHGSIFKANDQGFLAAALHHAGNADAKAVSLHMLLQKRCLHSVAHAVDRRRYTMLACCYTGTSIGQTGMQNPERGQGRMNLCSLHPICQCAPSFRATGDELWTQQTSREGRKHNLALS